MSSRSSRRSSQASLPKWRSLSTSKRQQPATSLSLVFAQPERGSPLRPAVEQLPLAVSDDTSSLMSDMSRKRERFHSTTSLAATHEEGQQPDATKRSRVESGDAAVTSSDESSSGGEDSQHSPPRLSESPLSTAEPSLPAEAPTQAQSVPFPTAEPRLAPPATRSSWFGSLSRAKGRDRLLKSDEHAPDANSNATPSVQITAPAADPQPGAQVSAEGATASPSSASHSQPESISRPQPVASAVRPNGSLPMQVSSPQQEGIPTIPSTRSILSVDEEVPQRHLTTGNTPPSQSAPVLMQSQSSEGEQKPSVASLNPSTSRFMLRIPLLGRPKMSLDQVVAAQVEGPKENGLNTVQPQVDASPPPSANPETTVPTVEISEPPSEQPSSPDSVGTESLSPQPSLPPTGDDTPNASAHTASNSSWWDYVGWSRSSMATAQEPSGFETNADKPMEAEMTSPDLTSQPPESSPETLQPSQASPPPMSPPQLTVTLDESQNKDPAQQDELTRTQTSSSADGQKQKPPSVFSAETNNTQTSAWYSPWAWYAASPQTPSHDATTSEQREEVAQALDSEAVKTESEMVKEEALRRDEPAPTEAAPAHTSPAPSPQEEAKNPIESSISTHRSSWVNFFTSRALISKSITYESKDRDENGMEVMDIDEDEDKGDGVSAGESSTPTPAIAIPASTPTASQPPSALPSPKSVGALPRREVRKSGGAPPSPSALAEAGKHPRSPSPAPSKVSVASSTTPRPPPRNLVLPTWEDTFHLPPRSTVPPTKNAKSKLSKTFSFVSGVLFTKDEAAARKGKGREREREREHEFAQFGKDLPKALDVVGEQLNPYILSGGCRVVVIGVAGWSPGPVIRTIAGGLPSSSSKFVNMTVQALEQFEQEHGFKFKKITKMPLDGDGTIERKVSKVHKHLLENEDWMEDLHAADVIFVATHSQGSIISTHLIDRLIRDGHILTSRSVDVLTKTAAALAPGGAAPTMQAQRICFLALCGIHLGPLRYLKTSSLLQPYIQYFENAAASELFEFQNTETRLSKDYTKTVYIASLNDQVVPIYSGLFTAASHPRILRAVYIDGDAYHSSDFLANLLVLLIRIMNSGLSDGGLLAHLSEATAGTLSGVGHSSIYEEPATFSLAVNYFFLSNDGDSDKAELKIDAFDAVTEQNDYEIPWSLRDMIADDRVAHFFAQEFAHLRDAFDDWQPKTTILRDVKRKLQPIQRLTAFTSSGTVSKL
ncbi:hypothetical protein B0H21DRAFT_748321 [Amylocystis lapponica]|nr:hypothetical protein B0H21DRAFT_748321 [Amylocystis lapponica]